MRTLIVMAKAPRAGAAKTRLANARGPGSRSIDFSGAARLAEAFLRDTLDHCAAVPEVDLVISYAPREEEAYFRALLPSARFEPQAEGDLGVRVRSAFDAAFERGAAQAIVVGSDTPHVGASAILRAFEQLDVEHGVIGPSRDGGYYLLGLHDSTPVLFEGVEWSTPHVFAQTMRAARAAGISLCELAPTFDVDEPRDLEELRAHLARGDADACPHTVRVLRELGLA